MLEKKMVIKIPTGLEARPVALFVQIASQYDSKITVNINDKTVNAKSIMGMMSLELAEGEVIHLSADGADEQEAVAHLEKYLSEEA